MVDSKIAAALLDAVTAAPGPPRQGGRKRAGLPALHARRVGHAAGGRHQDSKCPAGSRHRDLRRSAACQPGRQHHGAPGAKADATLLASYATNAALSASKTTLQSVDAILAELAALQLSGSGGVVNAPAWEGFTTWELVRGSNVVCNLHLGASLSAALANGDDTLSITADCYSTAGTDAAITAAFLAYYTLAQVDALLGDYRAGAAQDAETTSAITGALLAYYTSVQADALLGDWTTHQPNQTHKQETPNQTTEREEDVSPNESCHAHSCKKWHQAEKRGMSGVGWAGLGWVGLGWVWFGWVGLGWVGLVLKVKMVQGDLGMD